MATILVRQLAMRAGQQSVRAISTTSSRFNTIPEFPDYLKEVAPFPRTKEERERAARKYNLIPEDYEPYEESEAFGDYPKLKAVGAFNRDRYDDYDDYWDRRFYGEPLHRDQDLYIWERLDPLSHEKADLPVWQKFLMLVTATSILPVAYWFFHEYRIYFNHNFKKRTYHSHDEKYYEFPQISDSHNSTHH